MSFKLAVWFHLPMRVVHIGNLPLTPDHPECGNVVRHPGRWVLNHALAQKAHTDIDPEIVVQVPGTRSNHITEWDGIRVHYLAAPDRFRSATLFRFDARRIGRYVLGLKPNLVHAHGTEEANLLAAQWTGLPYVVTAQGLYSQINSVMPPKTISRASVIEWIERRSLARAKHIIAKSDYVADWIKSQYPHLEIHHIPNTFDPRLLDIPIPDKEPGSIVFIGMISPRKGLHLLADALRHSPSTALHIIGNPPWEAMDDYQRTTIGQLQTILGTKLHLHGIVPSIKAVQLVASCELLVAPSLEEMFGNQVIEALLLGTWPVVSSQTAMEENVIRIGAGSVFENGNESSLTEGIQGAFSSLLAWNRENTRQSVINWLGPEVVARAHNVIYRRLKNES